MIKSSSLTLQQTSSLGQKEQSFEKTFVTLNLDGRKIKMLKTSFEKLPIYRRIESETVLVIEKRYATEYFLENRDFSSFMAILYYFRNNELHVPQDVCINIFRHELRFWDINDEYLKTCCFVKYAHFYRDQEAAKRFRQRNYLSEVETITKKMVPWKAWVYKLLHARYIDSKKNICVGAYRITKIFAVLFLVFNMAFRFDHSLDQELTPFHWSEFYEKHIDELYELCKGSPELMTTNLLKICDDNFQELKKNRLKLEKYFSV